MQRRDLLTAAWGAVLVAPLRVTAQSGFPSKPVRILIPFTAGQGSDILARALAEQLAALWHKPVVVENRPGANGSIAAQELANAPADGHTLLLTSNSPMVVNPVLYKNLAYDVQRDFQPVALLSTTPLALVCNTSQPFQTVQELVAYAKAHPGTLSYASIGAGSTSHMCTEAFKQATGVDAVHVPYQGSAPALTDVVAGHVHFMIDGLPSALPHVKSGKARALAVTGSKPSAFLPDVPTLESLDIQGVPAGGWYGLMAKRNADQAAVQRVLDDVRAVMRRQAFRDRLLALNLEVAPELSSAEFGAMIEQETKMWEQTAKRLSLYQSA